MKKELLVTLIKKDIAELLQMTDGFNDLDYFPPVLLKLAQDKAHNIENCLQELGTLSVEKTKQVQPEPVIAAPVVQPIVEVQPEPAPTVFNPQPEAPKPMVEPQPITELESATEIIEEKAVEEEIIEPESAPTENPEPYVPEEKIEPELVEELPEEDECEEEVEAEEEAEIEESEEQDPVAPVVVQESPVFAAVTRNDQLQNQKVDDIKQAISIGDRFLFQRELFKNSGELLSKTITTINACKSRPEAEQYLTKKFSWDMENPTVERFMQIVARKFD